MAFGPYHCLLKWNVQGRPAANVLYFDLNEDIPGLPANSFGVATKLEAAWVANIVPLASAAAVYQGVIVTEETKGSKYETTANISGGGSGGALPPNTTYLIRKSLSGTSKSGRLYFPGVAESQVDDGGNVASGIITAFNSAWATFYDAVKDGGTNVLAVKGFVGGGPTPNYYPITEFNCDGKVASQRRRLRK